MRFRIFCEGKPVTVRIFTSFRSMLREARRMGIPQPNDTKAFAHSLTVVTLSGGRKPRVLRTRRIRTVFFCDKRIGGGVVAHEMAHMALFVLGERGVKSVDTFNAPDSQEPFCRALQELVRGFWDRFYELSEK